jgi:hypothetical protein
MGNKKGKRAGEGHEGKEGARLKIEIFKKI